MGAARLIKATLKGKGLKQYDLAEMADMPYQSFRNMLNRDTMLFEKVEEFADLLDCDIVFRDRDSGEIYG